MNILRTSWWAIYLQSIRTWCLGMIELSCVQDADVGATLCGKHFSTVYTEDTSGRVVLPCSGCNDRTGAWEWLSCPVFRIWWDDLVLRNDWVVLCSGYDVMTGAWEWLSCPVFRIWWYDLVLRNDWVVLCSGYDVMTGAWEWLSCPPVFRL